MAGFLTAKTHENFEKTSNILTRGLRHDFWRRCKTEVVSPNRITTQA